MCAVDGHNSVALTPFLLYPFPPAPLSHPSPLLKARAAVVRRVIEVAMELLKINNLNGVMEMSSALQASPVKRLKATWRNVGKEHTAMLDEIVRLLCCCCCCVLRVACCWRWWWW